MNVLSRYRGALLGLAAGDALGTTVEFQRPGTFKPVTEIVGGGVFGLNPGEWTDDTSMALCLAESLIETGGFDPVDQLTRYLRWYREGHLTCNGTCFDIGNTVRTALEHFSRTGNPWCGPTDRMSAGNGSLMRLAPVPLRWAPDAKAAIERSGESSRTTHGAKIAIDACRYFAGLLVGAVQATEKDALLSPRYAPITNYWQDHPLVPEIDAVAAGSFKQRQPPAIEASGYVAKALEAALWAFHRTTTFEDGCRAAVNLGDDADTAGAIYGQLAGAFYGEEAIPSRWRGVLARRDLIISMADRLCSLSSKPS